MIYVVIFFFLLILTLLSFYSSYYKKVGIFSATIILILLAAFRYNTGTDFGTYAAIWAGIPSLASLFNSHNFFLEPGFIFLSSILKTIYTGDFIFFSVYAGLTIFLLTYTLHKLDLHIVAGLLLYFCLFYFAYVFNGIRQALSMSIFLYSLISVKEERWKRFYLINFIGLLFHYSSIVYLILGPIFFLKVSKKQLIIYAVILFLFALFAYITGTVEIFIRFIFGIFFQSKIHTYFVNYKESISIIEFLPRIALLGWIMYCSIRLPLDKTLVALVFFYAIGFAFYLSLLEFNMLATRINMLFRITEIVISLLLINKVHKSRNKLLIYSGFLLIYTFQFYVNINLAANQYIFRSSF